jgi:hypothetical protein
VQLNCSINVVRSYFLQESKGVSSRPPAAVDVSCGCAACVFFYA